MNLQSMQPHPFDATGHTFQVFCSRCGKSTNSADVECDLDAPAGTFYCQHCAAMVQAHAE
jgi:late competence protein required for DNA uptake (superfamily II DNA/RNA helicase)